MRTPFIKITLAVLFFAFQMVFAKEISKECINEFINLPSKQNDFALDNFLKELPSEILKTKAQMKLPFGKPNSNKITDIGISVGCLNAFPENSEELVKMVQSIGVEIAKKIIDLASKGKSSSDSEAEYSSSSETKSSSSSESQPSSSSGTQKKRKEAK